MCCGALSPAHHRALPALQVLDIEDLARIGESRAVCPYFLARRAGGSACCLARLVHLLPAKGHHKCGLVLTGVQWKYNVQAQLAACIPGVPSPPLTAGEGVFPACSESCPCTCTFMAWGQGPGPRRTGCAGCPPGPKLRLCRGMASTAEIVFMPYNYLIDYKTRAGLNIQWQGAVLIFDEAHNVEVRACTSL